MGVTNIQWADFTFNPWLGCTKVAPECQHCYAEELMQNRYGRVKWGKGQKRARTSASNWKLPLKWNRMAEAAERAHGQSNHPSDLQRPRVFCASLSDWLDDEVPIEWLADLLRLIHETPNLDWLLLTKRPQNWRRRVELATSLIQAEQYQDVKDELEKHVNLCGALDRWLGNHKEVRDFYGDAPDSPPQNVWIGVSAGADLAAALAIPAKVHFLSCEPMLRPMDETHAARFDWIIFGAESGKNARVCDLNWIRKGIAFCVHHGIAPFVKQIGRCSIDSGHSEQEPVWLHDKKGGDPSEWPEDLRVREFPS